MNNPTLLTLFSAVFILLGAYNVLMGPKRMREAQAGSRPIKWYKQINILTGTEYILLALVFIVSSAVRSNTLPPGLSGIVVPLYFVLLIAAAVLAGLVIRQGILNARAIRAQSSSHSPTPTAKSNSTRAFPADTVNLEDPQHAAPNLHQSPERRR